MLNLRHTQDTLNVFPNKLVPCDECLCHVDGSARAQNEANPADKWELFSRLVQIFLCPTLTTKRITPFLIQRLSLKFPHFPILFDILTVGAFNTRQCIFSAWKRWLLVAF